MIGCLRALLLCAVGILSSSISLPKSPEIVVVGSVVIDFVAYTSSLPLRGETVFGSSFAKNYGGKGANQVLMMSGCGDSYN